MSHLSPILRFAALISLIVAPAVHAPVAGAAPSGSTFTVNSTLDLDDSNPGGCQERSA
jgi:hypothetical protein